MIPGDPSARSTASGIILVAAALMTVGLVAAASTSASLEAPILRADFFETPFGRQTVFATLGFAIVLLVARMGHEPLRWRPGRWLQPSVWLLLATIACLILVWVPGIGVERNGARRWMQLGVGTFAVGFQPSELAKLTLVIFLAACLARQPGEGIRRFFKGLLPAALTIGLCAALVGAEDFGTAVLLAAVGGLMLLAGGARLLHLLLLTLPALATFAWLLVARPYRLQRLTAFADIWSDPRGEGYHPIQSLITIASGRWFGQGLGSGTQKYGYLPESSTDFVFAVWCEETGLVGAVTVLLLFGLLLYLGTRAARAARTAFGRLVALGVTLMVTLQAVMNIAVVTAAAPTKGIALPLVSAGGSGIVFLGASIGLLAGIARRGRYDRPRRSAAQGFSATHRAVEAPAFGATEPGG
jgi:cell division protein FtsW